MEERVKIENTKVAPDELKDTGTASAVLEALLKGMAVWPFRTPEGIELVTFDCSNCCSVGTGGLGNSSCPRTEKFGSKTCMDRFRPLKMPGERGGSWLVNFYDVLRNAFSASHKIPSSR